MSKVSEKVINNEEFEITPEGRINPFNKKNKDITVNWVENLLKKYGIFRNINSLNIYKEALTHTSYTIPYIKEVCMRDNVEIIENPDGCILLRNKSYERLEFLGDTLLDAIMGSYLFNRFPDGDEGFLSLMKKKLISRWVIGDLSKICGLPEYLIISKTLDDKQNARNDIKKCCDLLEAFLGALYIDLNKYEFVEKFIINLLEHPDTLFDMTSYITDGDNSKSKLRNYVRRVEHCDAKYIIEDLSLYDEENIFVEDNKKYKCEIFLKKKKIAIEYGDNIKELKFKTASKALKNLGVD